MISCVLTNISGKYCQKYFYLEFKDVKSKSIWNNKSTQNKTSNVKT